MAGKRGDCGGGPCRLGKSSDLIYFFKLIN